MEGIELLKKVLKDCVNTFQEYQRAKADDGKISKIELIGFGDNAIAIGRDILNINKIIAEAKDADTQERKELIDYVVGLDVLPDKAEIILVNTLEYIEGQVLLWRANVLPIINLFKN